MLREQDMLRIINGETFIIATDFDGTLTKETTYPAFGEATEWFYTLRGLQECFVNVKVILFTCREHQDLQQAIEFCNNNGLYFDAVNEELEESLTWKVKSRKPFAHIYVDDRAVDVTQAQKLLHILAE